MGRSLFAIVLIACALLLADTVAWFRLERRLDEQLAASAALLREAGWRFHAVAGTRGGWPLAATLTLDHPELDGTISRLRLPLDWTGERIVLGLSPIHPKRVTIMAAGTQSLTVGGSAPGQGGGATLRFWGASLALHLPDGAGSRQGTLTLDGQALHAAATGAGPDDVATLAGLTASIRWSDGAPGDASRLAVRVALHDLALPPRIVHTAGRIVTRATLDASLEAGEASPLTLRIEDGTLLWKDGGARLSGQAAIATGQMEAGADGHFVLHLDNPEPTLQAAAADGLLTVPEATALSAIIGLIDAGSGAAGSGVDLPLDLHDGSLGLGSIPLWRMRPHDG